MVYGITIFFVEALDVKLLNFLWNVFVLQQKWLAF